jgi:hypothetical protein
MVVENEKSQININSVKQLIIKHFKLHQITIQIETKEESLELGCENN